jgi:hypothetical protein
VATCVIAAAGLGAGSISGAAAGPPPVATFTPNVRADAGESGAGQNEPQVTVDQTGRTYVDWQSSTGAGGSAVASTTSGSTFTYLGDPDPSHGNPIDGDVDLTTTSWPSSVAHTPSVSGSGDNGIVFGHLNLGQCGAIEIRDATSKDQGATWNTTDSACAPTQIDRPWVAAYTPPSFRGTSGAVAHTEVFNEYHDFASSEIFVTRSFDGGTTWDPVQYPAIAPASIEHATTFCNSIPSGVAVDQRGAHKGRVYVMWETADQPNNLTQGCDLTQAEAFDHVFLSWSDDIGDPTVTTPTWTSSVVFNDPCAPTPPVPPTNPTSCQDVSELFNSLAVDDAGNVFAAYIFRDITAAKPEYDVYTSESTDGGNTFGAAHRVNTDTGSHYEPWIVAGASGAIDVVFYRTAEVEGTGLLQKPAGASASAVWDVYMAQSLDGGQSFTENKVSDANDATGGIYFGDICTTGIFCGATPPGSGWGADRTLFDVFGVAIGPDGGARVAWTDARASHTGTCVTGGTITCQTTHVMFACQSSGIGLHGETVTGCGSSALPVTVPDGRWVPATVLAGVAAVALSTVARRRRINRAAAR